MVAAVAQPAKWAREYETIFIVDQDAPPAECEKITDRLREVIARLNGTLTRVDNWGRRRLAYPIRRKTRGSFVYLKYVGFSDLVAELERNLRMQDVVVRFQTVLLTDAVDPKTLQIDPEEIKYRPIEAGADEQPEPDMAEKLGMVERVRPPREPGFDDDEYGAEDSAVDAAVTEEIAEGGSAGEPEKE